MGGDGVELYEYFRKHCREFEVKVGIERYDPALHKVNRRPNKEILTPTGDKDKDGNDIIVRDEVETSKIALQIEKYIIEQRASFVVGNGISLEPNIENSRLFEKVKNNWYDNKLDYDLKEIDRNTMAVTHSAIIFYGERGAESIDDFRFRHKIVSPLLGDSLYPFFDEDTDDLVAFGREYVRDEKTRYDLYVMNERGYCDIYRYENGKPLLTPVVGVDINGNPITTNDFVIIETPYTKLPVIYFSQPQPECEDSRKLIEEHEENLSSFFTQLGYSGDPILFGTGQGFDMPMKGSAGKYIEGDVGSDLKYVTPDNATESRDLSIKIAERYIFGLNRAVLLDAETMKGFGSGLSGEAIKRMLTDVYMAAKDRQQGVFGKGIQRALNWLVHETRQLMGGIDKDLRIYPVFSDYSFNSKVENVELAMKANGNKPVIDQQSSITIAGLSDNSEVTLEKIKQDGGNS